MNATPSSSACRWSLIRLVCPFGKNDQRPFGLGQQVDRHVDRLPIDALAIDAEGAHHLNRPSLKPAVVKQVPTGHHVRVAGRFDREPPHRQRIGRAWVVRRQQNAMPRPERFVQPVKMANLVRLDPSTDRNCQA